MERLITGYHLDDEGDWVAELSCGHDQHVRHRPPFQLRSWVLDAGGRDAHLGNGLDCPWCDRAELPVGLRFVRSSQVWDEHTMPQALRRAHRIAGGTWGRIVVQLGRLRFVASTAPPLEIIVDSGTPQAVPPDMEHAVEPLGSVRFSIDFLVVDREQTEQKATGSAPTGDEGGDPACWAHLVSEDTGAIRDGGTGRSVPEDGGRR